MLAELRKYKAGLIYANQYLDQLDRDIRDSVLGNVGSIICFRLRAKDGPYFEREFVHRFRADDFISLPNYAMYVKLMVNGAPEKAFSARALAPYQRNLARNH